MMMMIPHDSIHESGPWSRTVCTCDVYHIIVFVLVLLLTTIVGSFFAIVLLMTLTKTLTMMMWLLQHADSSASLQLSKHRLSLSADNLSTLHISSSLGFHHSTLSSPSSSDSNETDARSSTSAPGVSSPPLHLVFTPPRGVFSSRHASVSPTHAECDCVEGRTSSCLTVKTESAGYSNSASASRRLRDRELDTDAVRNHDIVQSGCSEDSSMGESSVTGLSQQQQQQQQSDRLHCHGEVDLTDAGYVVSESNYYEDMAAPGQSPVSPSVRSRPRRSGSHVITRKKAFYNIQRPLSIVRRDSAPDTAT